MNAARPSVAHSSSRSPPPRNSGRCRRRAHVRRRRLAALSGLIVAAAILFHPATSAARRLLGKTATTGPAGHPVSPALFSPGACSSFPPTAGDRHQTVFVDAGHGGIDPGATGMTESGQTIHEADLTLPVELDTMAMLRAQGFTVVVSRTGATSVVRLGPADLSEGALSIQGAHDDVDRPASYRYRTRPGRAAILGARARRPAHHTMNGLECLRDNRRCG
jgi:N-acetylmuramoyl-L-alanine amidase